MPSKPSSHDVFDVNKKTGALILGSNRLDDYAAKYLNERCPEALHEPMALPLDDILKSEGLVVEEASLSENGDVFGCCVLVAGEVPVIDEKTGLVTRRHLKEGTILIDPEAAAHRSTGSLRNTLIHEAIHWEKDRTYFQIKALQNSHGEDKPLPYLCRSSETFLTPSSKNTRASEERWLEWQAHRLAPRVLMPKEAFKKKAQELIQKLTLSDGDCSTGACDSLVEELSNFFIASRLSVKFRLNEVGLTKQLTQLPDYEDVFSEIDSSSSHVKLTASEAYALLEDPQFALWVRENHLVFTEGYFVWADGDCVKYSEGRLCLTPAARRNLKKFALNIRSYPVRDYAYLEKDLEGTVYLYRAVELDKRLVTFDPSYQTDFNCNPDAAYAAFSSSLFDMEDSEEFLDLIGRPSSSLCQCLSYLLDERGIKYPAQFVERTLLHENYLGKIRNGACDNMASKTLMTICVGLGLGLRTVQKLFDKAKTAKLDETGDLDRTCLKIIEKMPGLPIYDFNSILEQQGLEPLGTKSRS